MAIALSDLVEMNYLSFAQAESIARAWLYENPKEFYHLDV